MVRKVARLPTLHYGAMVLQAPNTSAEAKVYWMKEGGRMLQGPPLALSLMPLLRVSGPQLRSFLIKLLRAGNRKQPQQLPHLMSITTERPKATEVSFTRLETGIGHEANLLL